jgi:hypothetical protein
LYLPPPALRIFRVHPSRNYNYLSCLVFGLVLESLVAIRRSGTNDSDCTISACMAYNE